MQEPENSRRFIVEDEVAKIESGGLFTKEGCGTLAK